MVAVRATKPSIALDRLMERATRALIATCYFECETISRRALFMAHAAGDYDRLSRVVMPLLESRRLRRQAARDAGGPFVVSRLPSSVKAGYYLIGPPLPGIAARELRTRAERARVAVVAMAREPRTDQGLCPVVAVGSVGGVGRLAGRLPWPVVARTRVSSPGPTDNGRLSAPSIEWFEAASEALGDAAIAGISPGLHPCHRVDDLLQLLDAHPDHEKLHQRLAEASREALASDPPSAYRVREFGDPACFI